MACLQGGAEFGPDCREMDTELLDRATGPVVVLPLAATAGEQYQAASTTGTRYYRSLGADVRYAPDARHDLPAALAALREAGLVMLPGGSPGRLRDALSGAVVEVLRERAEQGAVLVGASAGAMVLCEWTALPDRGGEVVHGTGLVPGFLVVPHFHPGDPDRGWTPPAGIRRLGIPEQSGVVVADGALRSVGARASVLLDGPEAGEIPR
jgi:peptidase E